MDPAAKTVTRRRRTARPPSPKPIAPPPAEREPAAPAAPAAKQRAGDAPNGLDAAPPEICPPDPFDLPDRYATQALDRAYRAHLARFTFGITPFGLASTVFTWWVHLLGAPGKQVQLAEKAARKAARFAIQAVAAARDPTAAPCIEPLAHDTRFRAEDWRQPPYSLIYQGFLLTQQWWHVATNDIDGLRPSQARVVSFLARQILDLASPSNFPWTNPEVARHTLETGGANLIQGARNWAEDWERAVSGKPPLGADAYRPGREVATSPGKIVYRNRLIELIQYSPRTETVRPEPILIVPAWIMKYYILDLSPHNSLVRYLVDRGYTVFMISWRNPTAEDRDLDMDAYLDLGIAKALEAIGAILPGRKVHAAGYCIGGTLLAIAAAAMARDRDDRLASLTFLATQTDFTEAGELMLFISESQVSFLDDLMWEQGYLDTKQMAGAFQLLRSNDLIWSRYVHDYLMGKRQDMFDLMAWNADATRMPYRMHARYLRDLFLGNKLARGQYEVDGQPVVLSAIKAPIFCVSTETDHVAPWHSVYKLHLLTDTELTFVLTSGGHNAGIVSEPGHGNRRYRLRATNGTDHFLSPERWLEEAEPRDGSWWPAWGDWLDARSGGPGAPPRMGARAPAYRPKEDAPGRYVLMP